MLSTTLTAATLALSSAAVGVQLRRALRTPAGVSAATWAVIVVMNLGWGVHYLNRGLWYITAANTCFALGALGIAQRAGLGARGAALTAGGVGAMVLAEFYAPLLGAGLLVGATVGMSVPQALVVWRGRDLGGVAVGTWVANLGVSLLWMSWALLLGLPVPVAANILAACVSGYIVVALARSRRVTAASVPSGV